MDAAAVVACRPRFHGEVSARPRDSQRLIGRAAHLSGNNKEKTVDPISSILAGQGGAAADAVIDDLLAQGREKLESLVPEEARKLTQPLSSLGKLSFPLVEVGEIGVGSDNYHLGLASARAVPASRVWKRKPTLWT